MATKTNKLSWGRCEISLKKVGDTSAVAIYANHQIFWVEILCSLILLSYFEVVIGII